MRKCPLLLGQMAAMDRVTITKTRTDFLKRRYHALFASTLSRIPTIASSAIRHSVAFAGRESRKVAHSVAITASKRATNSFASSLTKWLLLAPTKSFTRMRMAYVKSFSSSKIWRFTWRSSVPSASSSAEMRHVTSQILLVTSPSMRAYVMVEVGHRCSNDKPLYIEAYNNRSNCLPLWTSNNL